MRLSEQFPANLRGGLTDLLPGVSPDSHCEAVVCFQSFLNRGGCGFVHPDMQNKSHPRVQSGFGFLQEVRQQLMTGIGEHAFGMELHPLHVWVPAMPQTHDRAVLKPGCDLQAVRQ